MGEVLPIAFAIIFLAFWAFMILRPVFKLAIKVYRWHRDRKRERRRRFEKRKGELSDMIDEALGRV